uniref:Uncharacterized protein n=1 Tax=Solanum demissum TaxID=50514 RepID=Q6L3S1_SOLDE|nr:hypothetical protein SDM1_41t00018 [Solanum demissum]
MHKKGEGLILKGKDKRTDLIDEADQKKDAKRDKSLASKVTPLETALCTKLTVGNRSGLEKKDMTAWENSSSDSDDSKHCDDSFMAKSDEEDDDEKVTLSYLKQNLNTFSTNKLRKLVVVLLDLISERMTKNDIMNNSLDIPQDGKIIFVAQISDIENQMVVREAKNLELKEKIKGATTGYQLIKFALERNLVLERDLVYVKEELDKSLKWITSSKIHTNLIGQGNNSRGVMDCEKIDPPYNPHSKTISYADNLLYVHCGRDEHLKKDCLVLKNGCSKHVTGKLKTFSLSRYFNVEVSHLVMARKALVEGKSLGDLGFTKEKHFLPNPSCRRASWSPKWLGELPKCPWGFLVDCPHGLVISESTKGPPHRLVGCLHEEAFWKS